MSLSRTVAVLAIGVALGVAATLAAQQAPAASRREPQFENASAKAWKSIIMPKQPLSYHRHDHARAIIALTDGTLDLVEPSGASKQNVWQAGKAYWYGPDAPGTTHADVNNTDRPIEVIVVELQQP
ncbi:MAG: hypothetical protein R2708_18645 [Vicinamibacterales bacterium]